MSLLDDLLALEPRDPRVLTLDIETSPHIAYVWGLYDQRVATSQIVQPSRVLCVAAKWLDSSETIFLSEFHDGREAMIAGIWQLVDEADIVVGYNHVGFDMPHLNREWLLADYGPPSPYTNVDLYKVNRQQVRQQQTRLRHRAPGPRHQAGDRRAGSLESRPRQ